MFTDPKMEVAAGSTVGLKITGARKSKSRPGGRSEVCRATDYPGKIRRNGIEDFGRGVASGDSLAISWKNGNVLRPVPRQFAILNLIEFRGKLGKLLPVLCELLLPLFARFAAPSSNPGLEMLVYPAGNQELGVGRPTVSLLHQLDLVFAERLAVRGTGILPMRRTIADMTIDDYDRGSARRPCGIPQRALDAIQIVGIPDTNDVPSIRQESPGDVFGERDIGLAFDGDVIVVVDPAEVIELQVPGDRGCLARDSFHHAAIAAECVNAVSEQFKIWLVVTRGEPLFRNGHAHTRGHTLSERTGGCFHARGPTVLRVPSAAAPELPERLEVVDRDGGAAQNFIFWIDGFDSCEVQDRVQQSRCVPRGKHEAIAIHPNGIFRVEPQKPLPQAVNRGGHTHRRAGVTGIRLLDRVDGQRPHRVHAYLVQIQHRLSR